MESTLEWLDSDWLLSILVDLSAANAADLVIPSEWLGNFQEGSERRLILNLELNLLSKPIQDISRDSFSFWSSINSDPENQSSKNIHAPRFKKLFSEKKTRFEFAFSKHMFFWNVDKKSIHFLFSYFFVSKSTKNTKTYWKVLKISASGDGNSYNKHTRKHHIC